MSAVQFRPKPPFFFLLITPNSRITVTKCIFVTSSIRSVLALNSETALFENSVSWFKKDSKQFEFYLELMNQSTNIAQGLGYEVLVKANLHSEKRILKDSPPSNQGGFMSYCLTFFSL